MLFKRFTKDILDREVMPGNKDFSSDNTLYSSQTSAVTSSYDSLLSASQEKQEEADISEEPETIIGEHVSIKGSLTFQRLIRIDGKFEGELISQGKIIIGPTGHVKADLNLEEAYIAGKVEGNITVKQRLVLRGRAEVKGHITAPLLSVDEGVSIEGQLHVARTTAPLEKPEEEAFNEEPLF